MMNNNNQQRSSPPSSSTSSPLTPLQMMNSNGGMIFGGNLNENMPPPSSVSPSNNNNNNNLFSGQVFQQFMNYNDTTNANVMLIIKQIQLLPPNQQQQYLNRVLQQLNNQLKSSINGSYNPGIGASGVMPPGMNVNSANPNRMNNTTSTNPTSVATLTMSSSVVPSSSSSTTGLANNNPTIIMGNTTPTTTTTTTTNNITTSNNTTVNSNPNMIQQQQQQQEQALHVPSTSGTIPTPNSVGPILNNVKNNNSNGLFDLTMFSNPNSNSKNPVLQNLSNDIMFKLYQQQMQSQHPFNPGDKFVFEQQAYEYQVESLDDLLKIGIGRWKNLIQSNIGNSNQVIPSGNMTLVNNNNVMNNMNTNSNITGNTINGMNGNVVAGSANQQLYVVPGNSAFQKYMKDSLHGSVQYFPQRQVDGSVKMNE